VAADVLFAGIAAAVAIEPRHGLERTDCQRLSKHIPGRYRFPTSVATVVPEHEPFPVVPVGLRQALWRPPLRFGRLVPDKSSTVLRCARLLGAPRSATRPLGGGPFSFFAANFYPIEGGARPAGQRMNNFLSGKTSCAPQWACRTPT
jgi:hypothetical protein